MLKYDTTVRSYYSDFRSNIFKISDAVKPTKIVYAELKIYLFEYPTTFGVNTENLANSNI